MPLTPAWLGAVTPVFNDGSVAKTATWQSPDQLNDGVYKGLHLVLNVSAIGSASLVPSIEGKGPMGTYYPLLTGPAIASNGVTLLKVYPGIGALSGLAASDILPPVWRVVMTHADANPATYTLAANLLR